MATTSELVQKIVDKADSDVEFRKQLIAVVANPKIDVKVIGAPVAVHAADIPVIAGTTCTGTASFRRV